MRRTAWSIAIVLILAACGDGSGSSDQPMASEDPTTSIAPSDSTASPPVDDGAGDEPGVLVPPGEDESLRGELWVGCWSGPYFQVSDLEDIEPLVTGDPGGVAEAIEPFLASGEGEFWPQDDWLILRETEADLLLVHQGSDGLAFMTVSRDGDAWRWSGSQMGGACPLHHAPPEGLNAVDWVLAPSSLPLDPAATSLDILATERECVGGQEMGDRLVEPQVVMTAEKVRVVLAAEPPPGEAFECPGNPETPLTVELPQPIGDREVIEGYEIGVDLEEYLP